MTEATFSFQKYAGKWQIGGPSGLRIFLTKRPRWLTRVLMRLLVEWEWIDERPGSAADNS